MLNLNDDSKVVVAAEGNGVNKYIRAGINKVRINDFAMFKARTGKFMISALVEGDKFEDSDIVGNKYEGLRGEHVATGPNGQVGMTIFIDLSNPDSLQSVSNDIIHIGTVTGTIDALKKISVAPTGDVEKDLAAWLIAVGKIIKGAYFYTNINADQRITAKGSKIDSLKFNRSVNKKVWSAASAYSLSSFIAIKEEEDEDVIKQTLSYTGIDGKVASALWTKNKNKERSWNYTWAAEPDVDADDSEETFGAAPDLADF